MQNVADADASGGHTAAPAAEAGARAERGARPAAGGCAVAVRDVVKRYGGVHAVKGVSFEVAFGEVVALAGENGAGKSTIKNMLCGIVAPDDGEIALDGTTLHGGVGGAQQLGVAAIHQELSLFGSLTVAENIFITDLSEGGGIVSPAALRKRAMPLLERVGADFSPGDLVEQLSTGRRQLVEIAKALSQQPRIVIFDEPTASLNHEERERVFAIVRTLRAEGAAVVYVSHHLDEVLDLADRVVVMRDGSFVAAERAAELDRARLEALMVGRELAGDLPRAPEPTGPVVLEVRGLDDGGRIAGIDLELRAGEIYGLAGLMGSGRTEVARAIFGLSRAKGEIAVGGSRIARMEPHKAIAAGVAFVTEDRRHEGLFIERSIRENLSAVVLGRLRGPLVGRLKRGEERAVAQRQIADLQVAARGGIEAASGSLSGGNQQKIVIGKWLARGPRVLIMDEPTRGIDVGAKAEIYRLLVAAAEEGLAILLISSEMNELIGICHRIGVMHAGRLAGELHHDEATPERIIRLATGGGAA